MSILVSAVPLSYWRPYERERDESRVCDFFDMIMDAHGAPQCDGRPEILFRVLYNRKFLNLYICRECADQVRESITEVITMLDARDIYGAVPKT